MSETIRAKEFIVVDDLGRDRARLGCQGDGVSLEMGQGENATLKVSVDAQGNARLEFRSGRRCIRLLIDEHRAQVKLKNENVPESSCGLTLDAAGAWVYVESTPDIGVRMLSNEGGQGAMLWLAEKGIERGDLVVRTRYVRPVPREDATSGWQWRGGA